MPEAPEQLSWVVLIGGLLQTVYLTILILQKFAALSSRIAVMEFQVKTIWEHMFESKVVPGDRRDNRSAS